MHFQTTNFYSYSLKFAKNPLVMKMALSNAMFFVIVFVCPLLLRQSYGQNVDGSTTLEPNSSSIATPLRPEPGTTLSPSLNDTTTDNYNSTTAETATTPFATTTEGPLLFNTTSSATDNNTSPSVSPSSPVNSTSELPQTSGSGGGQRFDLASFFGGIVLAVGLIGLVFFIYKVWQAKRSGYSNL